MSICLENNASTQTLADDWNEPRAYRIHLLITKDADGVFSAVALNLPGAGSSGDTEEEAISNAKEAIAAVLESYEEAGDEIPWRDTSSDDIPFGAAQKLIIVHV